MHASHGFTKPTHPLPNSHYAVLEMGAMPSLGAKRVKATVADMAGSKRALSEMPPPLVFIRQRTWVHLAMQARS